MALTRRQVERGRQGGHAACADAFVTSIDRREEGGEPRQWSDLARHATRGRRRARRRRSSSWPPGAPRTRGCGSTLRAAEPERLGRPRATRTTSFDWFIGVLPRYTGSSKGPGSAARCDFPGRGGLENVGGCRPRCRLSVRLQRRRHRGPLRQRRRAVKGGGRRTRPARRPRPAAARSGTSTGCSTFCVITDDDVEAQNRVTLSSPSRPTRTGRSPRVEVPTSARSARTRTQPRVPGEEGRQAAEGRRRARDPPDRLAAADPARAVDDAAWAPTEAGLGARGERRGGAAR